MDSIAFVARTRKSAPFQYKFRSDFTVRRLVDGLHRKHTEDQNSIYDDSSASETSICILSCPCSKTAASIDDKATFLSNTRGLHSTTDNSNSDPSIFLLDDSMDFSASVIEKKRAFESTGPLSITPSQKRNKLKPTSRPTLSSQPADHVENIGCTGKFTYITSFYRVQLTLLFLVKVRNFRLWPMVLH